MAKFHLGGIPLPPKRHATSPSACPALPPVSAVGVARWSDRFRAQDAGNFLLQLIPTEQYFPAALCRAEPPGRRRRGGQPLPAGGPAFWL